MWHLLRLLTVKRVVGALLLSLALFLLMKGPALFRNGPERAESQVLREFKQEHPETSDWITRQQDQYGAYETAVAIQSLRNNPSLNPEALKRDLEVRTRLVSVYEKDQAQDEGLLWSHGSALDILSDVPGQADQYLSELEQAQQDPDYWSLVRNDPIALTSQALRSDKPKRDYYRANQAWIGEMIEVLMTRLESHPPQASSADPNAIEAGQLIQLDDLLAVAAESDPYLERIVPQPKQTPIEACIYYETFRQFGEAIAMTAAQGVPVQEVVEVIILNRDALVANEDEEAGAAIHDPASVATRLVQLNRERPSVWTAAQRDGYVLSFDKLVPSMSQSILEKHPDLGVASLIVTQYGDVATQAAKIVDRYGELGVAVLVQYDGSQRFNTLLADANVDHRVAMLAALESDAGLEAVAGNAAYLNKLIADNGDPKSADWWTNVPVVGGLADVARNQAKGYPSDWSEIGWAAWDVADIGLMVVSLGSSKIATTAAKQTAKGIGKKAATKLTTAGIKRSAPVAKQTAMSRMMTALKQSKATAPLRWTARTSIHAGTQVATAGGRMVATTNRVLGAVQSIPPGVRKWVARGLLATSLFVRAPDQLALMGNSLDQYVTDALVSTARMIPDAIANAMNEIKQGFESGMSHSLHSIVYMLIVAVTAILGLYALLSTRAIPAFALPGWRRTKSGSRKVGPSGPS